MPTRLKYMAEQETAITLQKGAIPSFIKSGYIYVCEGWIQIPVENKCEVRTVWGRITDKLQHKYRFYDNELMIWKTTKIYTGLKIPPAPKMSVPKIPPSRLQELMPSYCCIPVTELQNMRKYIKSSG